MRILIYSNPLVVDKISKQFLFYRDSGFLVTKQIIENTEGHRFTWLIPDKISQDDYWWFHESESVVDLVPYPYSTSIHQNRYEFHGDVLRENFSYLYDFDAIITNQPEVAMSLKNWSNNQRRDHPIICSLFHWIDCEASRPFGADLSGYFLRQWEGAMASDLVYFHPGIAEKYFDMETNEYGLTQIPKQRIRYFTPMPNIHWADGFYRGNIGTGKKIILFNHRLNNTTGWKEVVDVCKELYKERQDFVLWLTDKNGSLPYKKTLEEYPFVHVEEIPDEFYGNLLRSCTFGICNHKGYSTWNMAVQDMIHNGMPVLLPKDEYIYNYMYRGANQTFFGNREELKFKINAWLNENQRTLDSYNEDQLLYQHMNHDWHLPKQILDDIEGQILSRISKRKDPAKLETVANQIYQKGRVTKKEWVNDNWSFHVNSNFQLIRWKLLHNYPIADNINLPETEYFWKEY